jgi:RNA polymerase sigma-70 factor, ECF subfamily
MSGTGLARIANPAGLPEAELVQLAQNGDPTGLREIMRRNSPKLYRLARSVLRNESEAEDVLQETYLRAFQNISAFRGGSTLSTWLTRIAINEALQRLRRARPSAGHVASGVDGTASDTAEIIAFPTSPSEAKSRDDFGSQTNSRSTRGCDRQSSRTVPGRVRPPLDTRA